MSTSTRDYKLFLKKIEISETYVENNIDEELGVQIVVDENEEDSLDTEDQIEPMDVISRLNECVSDYDAIKKGDSTPWENNRARYETSVEGITYYIDSVKKKMLPKEKVDNRVVSPFCVVLNIALVDTSAGVVVANVKNSISDRKLPIIINGKKIDSDLNTGPVSTMRLLIDPFRNIVLTQYSNKGFSTLMVNKLLNKLFGSESISYGYILDIDDFNKLDDLTDVKSIEYKVGMPTNAKSFANETSSEFNDMKYAEYMEAKNVTIKMSDPNVKKIIAKAKSLLLSNKGSPKSVKVSGNSIHGEENLDFLKKKMMTVGKILVTQGVVISDDEYMNMFVSEYVNNLKKLTTLYKIERCPENGGVNKNETVDKT